PNTPGKIEQSQEALKRLESLGYASGGRQTRPDELLTQGLPDPKDLADVSKELQDEYRLYKQKKYVDALAILERAIKRSPNSPDIMRRLGLAYLKVNRDRESVETLKKALRLDPENQRILRALATALVDTRQYPEAVEHLKLLLEQSPD